MTATLAAALAGRAGDRRRLLPRDARRGRRRPPSRAGSSSPPATSATGRRPGRSTSSSATPSCTGCPGTSGCSPAGRAGSRPGGWLAVQVPGNFRAPTHALLAELCRSPRWAVPAGRRRTPAGRRPGAGRLLRRPGRRGPGPRRVGDDVPARAHRPRPGARPGSGAPCCGRCSPALDDDDAAAEFTAEYAAALRAAYPARPDGTTLLPFRRVFAVGTRPVLTSARA